MIGRAVNLFKLDGEAGSVSLYTFGSSCKLHFVTLLRSCLLLCSVSRCGSKRERSLVSKKLDSFTVELKSKFCNRL